MPRGLVYKVLASIVIAHLLVVLGRDDWVSYTLSVLYMKDMSISFVEVFILLELVDRITTYLNRRLPWKEDFRKRLVYQFGLVVIIPSILAMLITLFNDLVIYNQEVFFSYYLTNEFMLSVLIILIINMVFLTVYYIKNEGVERIDRTTVTLVGRRGNSQLPVNSEDIGVLVLKNEVIILTTREGQDIIMPQNLDHYETLLPDDNFFRVNRQTIISREACHSFKSIENGKIEIIPSFEGMKPMVVSQKRASRFRSWVRS